MTSFFVNLAAGGVERVSLLKFFQAKLLLFEFHQRHGRN